MDGDVLDTQVRLASLAIVRAVSRAVLQSYPGTAGSVNDDIMPMPGLPYYFDSSFGGGSSPFFTEQTVAFGANLRAGFSAIARVCHPSDGDFGARADAFVTSEYVRQSLIDELEANQLMPQYEHSALTGRVEMHYRGIPVLTGRVDEDGNTPSKTDVWAIKLSGPSAVKVLHLGGESANFGVQVEPKTLVTQASSNSNADSRAPTDVNNVTRGVEVFGIYSLQIPEVQSVARLTNVPNGAIL
jgi:hypothetical protein